MEVSDCPETAATNASRICGKCGSKIFADAPQGFCSLCLFKTGLGPLLDEEDESPESNLPIEKNFDDYELLKEIGRGGQGVVYRARQKSLNRTVALKVIGLGHWATEAHLRRFRLEAEAAASLNHPFIVPIHEIRERGGYCYFSMNLVEGGQLDEVAKRQAISIRRAAELIAKLARTVHYAHEHGILHRDIKPGNVLLDKEGEPHLTDFGLARLVESESTVTRTTDCLGTPSYMAPEQARGNKEIAKATDIYGLGAVLYHLLTGRPPFIGATSYETVRLLLETDPRQPRLLNSKVDRDLSVICMKCLEKDPERRYASALALAEDLERWLRHEPILARRTGLLLRGKKWLQRNPAVAVAVASLAGLAATMGVVIWKSTLTRPLPTTGIAVLPFENLSEEKANAYFADGIQDEILTRLSKIGDLKVISRSSTQHYRSVPKNLPEIARQLGVANILEGSVQKVADQVHVNVQLIRATTDEHLWAESYDRKLENIFGVEAEVATRVARALRARLTGAEEQAVWQKPTDSPQAYDAYLRGLAYALRPTPGNYERDTLAAVEHFSEAVKLDLNFALAWARLAHLSALGYFTAAGNDLVSLRETAQRAAARAVQLQPNLEQSCLAQGYVHYYCEQNYEAAVTSFEKARQLAPSASETLEALALISRRTDEWDKSLEYFREAIEIDPLNIALLSESADTFAELRQYTNALKIYDQALEIRPDNPDTLVSKAKIYQSQCNLSEAAKLLAKVVSDPSSEQAFPALIRQKIYERRFPEAIALLNDALERNGGPLLGSQEVDYRATLADVRQFSGDTAGARSTWEEVKVEIERIPASRIYGGWSVTLERRWLAIAYAALGDKAKALAIVPEARADPKDRLTVGRNAAARARIAMHCGEKAFAIDQVAIAAENQGTESVTYGDLKMNPQWDPLRGDPRFEQIVNSLAPR